MHCEDSPLTVGDLAAALEDRIPRAWAEAWDRVGLIVGQPTAVVAGVLVTLDASAEACERAAAEGANVLVTHHPPYLEAPPRLLPGSGPAGTPEAALRLGVSVICLHTNLDRAPAGASALPHYLGFEIAAPLESAPEPVAVVTTYVPSAAASAVRAAMGAAGAGRVGEYEACAFVSAGAGHFRPRTHTQPASAPSEDGVPEQRIEMVVSRSLAERVVAAARDAHPYEEPMVLAVDGVRARGVARLGRVCAWRAGATVGELAAHVSATLGVGVRVWGDPARAAGMIAVVNGSAASLMEDARACAGTLVAGEVRYHDAVAGVAAGLAIIEAGHDATEWPLVSALAQIVAESIPASVTVHTERPRALWSMMKETHG